MTSQQAFISYVREDEVFALRMGKELEAAGVDVWIDQLQVSPGAHWDRAVEEALQNCAIFLVVLSPDSIASRNVLDEINYAIESKKDIIPIVLRPCKLPLRLSRMQYLDFTSSFEGTFEQLKARLGQSVSVVSTAPKWRPWYRRLFLLYAPHTKLGWFLRVFFFLSLFLLAVIPLALGEDEDMTRVDKVITMVVWVGVAAFIGWLARLVDQSVGRPNFRKKSRRLLLLYWPDRTAAKAVHVIFYILCFFTAMVLIVFTGEWIADPSLSQDPDFIGILITYILFGLFCVVLRSVALQLDCAPGTLSAGSHLDENSPS